MACGQYGDLVINTVAIKWLKKLYPDCHFTLGIAEKYSSIAPLFNHNYLIDDIHIYEGYDNFPTENDKQYLLKQNFDGIFNPMPKHFPGAWYNHVHYGVIYSLIQGLGFPDDLQCYLNPWFGDNENFRRCVTISAFPSKSQQLDKTLSIKKWEKIVSAINKMGYRCIQLGGKYDIPIKGAERPDFNWVEAAQALHCSVLQITTDTSWAWIGSAYQCNVIGLYGKNYPDLINIQSHCPINPHATYFTSEKVNDIDEEKIIT